MPRPLTILIVEDSPEDAELLVAQLRRTSFEPQWKRVETEPDFLAGLKNLPDIILSDYSMPQFGGLRAVELLKQSGLNIPFILISGTVGEDVAVEAMKYGATDYLLKDRIARLGPAVERALREARERTEHEKLKTEVTLRERRLNSFFTRAPAGLVLLDAGLRYVQINDTVAEMNGVPVKDHLGKTVLEVLPKLAPVVEPILRKVLMTGVSVLNVEISGETPAQPGVLRHWMESFFPILGADGRPESIGVILVEITGRKNTEEGLRESERRFRELAETIQEVFWIADPAKSRRLYISPAYERIWARHLIHNLGSCIVPRRRTGS